MQRPTTSSSQLDIKGRGARNNPGNRFSAQQSWASDEEWYQRSLDPSPATELRVDKAKTIISTNQSPDIPFTQSINPYKGCEHGCVYCYARPSHEFLDLSPGLDFETRIFYKDNASQLLRKTFDSAGYRCTAITIGANTDPYQPAERQLQITRSILNVFLEYQHPVSLITKSSLVVRDIDVLQELAAKNLCRVVVSHTTLSKELKNKLEPRTASPQARLRVIRELRDAGIPVSVMCAPIIPFINDHELEDLVGSVSVYQPDSVNYILLRLPLGVADLFRDWLQQHYPERASRVMNTVQSTRGGKDYQAGFGTRMRGEGIFADLLAQRFKLACKRYGVRHGRENGSTDTELNCTLFRSASTAQKSLF